MGEDDEDDYNDDYNYNWDTYNTGDESVLSEEEETEYWKNEYKKAVIENNERDRIKYFGILKNHGVNIQELDKEIEKEKKEIGKERKEIEKENIEVEKAKEDKKPNNGEEKLETSNIDGIAANLIDLWDEIFNIYSFNNPEYSRACFHMMLGIILRKCRIERDGVKTDPRISVLYLKPTHSGGSAGYDMVALIAEKLGYKVKMVTEATDAALIGTWVKNKDEEWEFQPGILDKSQSDLVYWPESGTIFQKNFSPHSMKTRNFIQMGLNPIDSKESKFEKTLVAGGGKPIICNVEASLLLVTFPPKELDDEMLKAGTLQRFCFVPKTLDLDERLKNIKEDSRRYLKKGGNIKEKIERLIGILTIIKEKYVKGKDFSGENPDVWDAYNEYIDTYGMKFKNADLRIQEHMGSFLSACTRKSYSIAMHMAAIRGDDKITKNDIQYAFKDVLCPELDLIHVYLETRSEHSLHNKLEDEEFEKVARACGAPRNKNGKNGFLDLIRKCVKVKSDGATYKRFNNWKNQGWIIEENGKIKISK